MGFHAPQEKESFQSFFLYREGPKAIAFFDGKEEIGAKPFDMAAGGATTKFLHFDEKKEKDTTRIVAK